MLILRSVVWPKKAIGIHVTSIPSKFNQCRYMVSIKQRVKRYSADRPTDMCKTICSLFSKGVSLQTEHSYSNWSLNWAENIIYINEELYNLAEKFEAIWQCIHWISPIICFENLEWCSVKNTSIILYAFFRRGVSLKS